MRLWQEARKSLAWKVAVLPALCGEGIEPLNDIGQLAAAYEHSVGDVFAIGADSDVILCGDGKFDPVKLIIVGDEGVLDFTKLSDDACYVIEDYVLDVVPICMNMDGPWTDDELRKLVDYAKEYPKLSLGCLFPGLQESSG